MDPPVVFPATIVRVPVRGSAFPAFVGSSFVIVASVIFTKVVPLVLGLKIVGFIGLDVDPPDSAFEV